LLCSQARAVKLACAPSVGPGYDGRRAGELTSLRGRHKGATYDALWAAAVAARPDIVSVTSFNEWGEGTQIEPASARQGYRGYDGSWGVSGVSAQYAYLTRPAYARRCGHPARRLRATAVGRPRRDRRTRPPPLRGLARACAAGDRHRRERNRQGGDVDPLRGDRIPDRHARPHELAALALLDR